jgi:hypothetical protein
MGRSLLFGALVVASSLATAAGAAILTVDDDRTNCPTAAFTSIQDAIDAAQTGDVIDVCAGTYAEQLFVNKAVRVRGRSGAHVQPTGMVANTTSLRTGLPIAAVAVVSVHASLDRLDIDASAAGFGDCSSAPMVMGVFFRGASGALRRSTVHDIPCANGTAVVVQGTARSTHVQIAGNVIHDYQRGGIVANEAGVTATITGNTVKGDGATSDRVQNGIQVGFGARARVRRNVVQSNAAPSDSNCFFDAGNLSYNADSGIISDNVFTGNTAAVLIAGKRNRVMRNVLNGMSGVDHLGLDGISLFGDQNTVTSNQISNMSEAGIRVDGNANHVLRNSVSGSHEADLCVAARLLPGCADQLTTCGVGILVAGGSGNIVFGNTFADNDQNLVP